MKIVTVDAKEFDRYVKTEPDCSIYHTARWNGFFIDPKATYLYLAYEDDSEFYHAYALVKLVKKSIFSKLQAVIEFGYLINFYDGELLNSFNKDLCAYLKEMKVKELTVSPNILYETPFGNNDYLIGKLEEFGYRKEADTSIYTRNLETCEANESSVSFAVCELNKEEVSLIETQYGYEISDAIEYFDEDIKISVVTVDFDKTFATIEEKLNEDPENEEMINLKNDVESLKEKYGTPIIEYVCYICYDKHAYILYTDCLKNHLAATDLLWNTLSQDLEANKYKGFICSKPFKGSKEAKRIGEFTITL